MASPLEPREEPLGNEPTVSHYPIQIFLQLGAAHVQLVDPGALPFDHLPRSLGGKVGVLELLPHGLKIRIDALDFLGQPRALFNLFDAGQKRRLCANIAAAMAGVPAAIVERQLALFDKVHPDYGAGVRAALKGQSAE